MHIQQNINSNLLFIKNRKLYYLLTSDIQKVVINFSQKLNFLQQISKKNTITNIDEKLTISEININKEEHLKEITNKIVQNFYIVQSNITSKDVIQKNIFDQLKFKIPKSFHGNELNSDKSYGYDDQRLNISSVGNFITENQVTKIQFNDVVSIGHFYYNTDEQQINHDNNFFINESYTKNEILHNLTSKQNIIDYQNYTIINGQEFILKLYISDDFIQTFNTKDQNVIYKDVIFEGLQNQQIYLKLYDYNEKLLKIYKLKQKSSFDLQFKNITFNNKTFYYQSNYNDLIFYQYYHDNSICQKYYINFNNKKIFSKQLNYQVFKSNNCTTVPYLLLNTDSFIRLRVEFPKLIYVKDIVFNSNNLSNIEDQLNIYMRYALNDIILNKKKFINLQNNFYCKFLDIIIQNKTLNTISISSIQFLTYLFDNNFIKSDKKGLNKNNFFIINRQSLKSFDPNNSSSDYNFLHSTSIDNLDSTNLINKYNNGIYYNKNIDFENDNEFLSVLQPYQFDKKGEIYFSIKRQAYYEPTNFQYINCQFINQKSNTENTVRFNHFKILNQANSFPKYLVYYKTETQRYIYKHYSFKITAMHYQQNWICIAKQTKSTNNVDWETYNKSSDLSSTDYISFSYKNNSNVYELLLQLVIDNNIISSNCNYLYIDNNSKNGFVIQDLYQFKKMEQQPNLKIYTKLSNETEYLYMSNNSFASIPENTIRDFKIVINNGIKHNLKLYSIVLSNVNKYYNLQYTDFSLSGNIINYESSFIGNNFYNSILSINHKYNSELNSQLIQFPNTFFDKSNFQLIENKNNIHFSWKKNPYLQYIVLFDQYNQDNYKDYFLPFKQNYKCKSYDIFNEVYSYNCRQYEIFYNFDSRKIISKINIIKQLQFNNNKKYDYFYSYSEDGINYSQYQYCTPYFCFYAKNIIIKCISNDILDEKYIPKLFYYDVDKYYLTTNNIFDTTFLMQLENDKKYVFYLFSYFNGQFINSKLKLIYAKNILQHYKAVVNIKLNGILFNSIINKIQNKDNKILLKFTIPDFETNKDKLIRDDETIKIKIDFYRLGNDLPFDSSIDYNIYNSVLIQNINLNLITNNGQCEYNHIINSDFIKTFNIYSYKIIYYDCNENVSLQSDYVSYYFNNIPSVPTKLDVLEQIEYDKLTTQD